MLWYRRRTQPDWMRIWPKVPAQTWVRHEMHSCCDVFYPRCSFPACSLRHGRCMEGGDAERPTFFLYKQPHTCLIFSPVSRDIHQLSAPNQADLIRSHFYPIVVILVTLLWWLPAHTMRAPKGWSRISQRSTLYKYTRNLTILLKTTDESLLPTSLIHEATRLFLYYYHYSHARQITHSILSMPSFLCPIHFSPHHSSRPNHRLWRF